MVVQWVALLLHSEKVLPELRELWAPPWSLDSWERFQQNLLGFLKSSTHVTWVDTWHFPKILSNFSEIHMQQTLFFSTDVVCQLAPREFF